MAGLLNQYSHKPISLTLNLDELGLTQQRCERIVNRIQACNPSSPILGRVSVDFHTNVLRLTGHPDHVHSFAEVFHEARAHTSPISTHSSHLFQLPDNTYHVTVSQAQLLFLQQCKAQLQLETNAEIDLAG